MIKNLLLQQQKRLSELSQLKLPPELFDLLGINYSVIDSAGNYLIQNNSAIYQVSKGLTNAEVIDKATWLDCKRIMKSRKSEVKTEFFKDRYFFSVKQPIVEKNECKGIMVLSIDVTKQKQTELALIEQTQKNRVLQKNNEFLSIASHEIRGPLGNVISILEIIKRFFILEGLDKKAVKQMSLLEDGLSEAHCAINSIDYLLKLLAVFREGMKSEQSACNIRHYVHNLILTHEKNLKKILLQSEIDEAVSEEAKFDFYHLREILDILVENAIKYSYDEETVTISVHQKKDIICFTIKDNGIGISKMHLEKLLTPFISTLDDNDKEDELMQYRKPSIKLNYIKAMLDNMGGHISVKSEMRKGTEVTVTVPTSEITANKNIQNTKTLQKSNAINTLDVLLVEDNPLTLEIEKNELAKLVHQIDATENGLEAISLAQQKRYDVIFLDITLNDMTGVEVMQTIDAQYDDKTNSPYFVAVTSRASEEDVDFFITQGFTTVLTKPTQKSEFYHCLQTLLKIRESGE